MFLILSKITAKLTTVILLTARIFLLFDSIWIGSNYL